MTEKIIDLKKKTKKTLFFWRFIMTVAVAFYTAVIKHKGRKINCKGLKWPYLIIASHASFIDFVYNTKICTPHHSNYIASIAEFIKRESLFRGIGCFPKH